MVDRQPLQRAGFSLLLILALSPILVESAWSQGISGLSVAKNGSNSADSFENGLLAGAQKESVVAVQPGATSTAFTVRYAKIVGTDTGIFTSRTENFTGNYTITFSVTAPGSYSLAVNTSRVGALTLVDDGTASATATLSALTGSQTGGTLVVPGTLSLPAVATLSGNGGGNTAFSQPNSATITGVSNGVPQVHTLTFAWTASCASGSGFTGGDECAVRMGLPAEYDGETAGDYPGVGGRVQANDGHFVTVTFTSPCGNGTLEPGENEDCDEGANNGAPGFCCNADCSLVTAGTQCRALAGGCDVAETCDGVNGTCPSDAFEPIGTVCRAGSSGDLCDLDETCTGLGAACPPDIVQPAGTVCRAQTGLCDIEETCDGVVKTCPTDAVEPAGTTCRAAAGVCDVDEECDGVGKGCPANVFVPGGTSCRSALDVCDIEETCTGSNANCPPDAVEPATTVCRGVADDCDVAETCDGVGTACPADGFAPSSVVCRAVTIGDVCDLEETCTGSSAACPADDVAPSGVVCRSVTLGDVCDLEETCDGIGKTCPPDAVASAGTVCRAVAGDCDVEEQCDGVSVSCPADGFVAGGTSCRAAVDVCDAEETCTGSSADCPADGVLANGTECRAAADLCDAAETCDGVGTACPADGVASAGTECRAAAGVCDVAEECDGVSASCPADDVATAGTVCRAASGECDVAEECDGVDVDCPVDEFEDDGISCTDDGLFCTGVETCQAGSCVGDGDPCGVDTCDEINDQCVTVGCGVSPLNGCLTAQKSILLYKDKSPDTRDKLVYKWVKGQNASQGDFADPINSAQYDLCVYSGVTPGLIFEANVPPSSTKWKTLSTKGFKFKDSNLVDDGTQRIVLKGSTNAKSKVLWKGKGGNLPETEPSSLPVAPGDFPVVVQVINNDNGMCFETTFDAADVKKNEADQLRLKDQ